MKTVLAMLMAMSVSVLAGYTYEIKDGDYFIVRSLSGSQSILFTGGGGHDLNLFDNSRADVQNTSSLAEGYGGIWDITAGGYSSITVGDGEIHDLAIGTYATAHLSGGWIDRIWSYYGVPDSSRITLVCNPGYQITYTGSLATAISGTWQDGSAFSIQLVNPSGNSPVLSNMTIIPEPTTILLVCAGGLFLKHRRK
jgi:hypothetical protein